MFPVRALMRLRGAGRLGLVAGTLSLALAGCSANTVQSDHSEDPYPLKEGASWNYRGRTIFVGPPDAKLPAETEFQFSLAVVKEETTREGTVFTVKGSFAGFPGLFAAVRATDHQDAAPAGAMDLMLRTDSSIQVIQTRFGDNILPFTRTILKLPLVAGNSWVGDDIAELHYMCEGMETLRITDGEFPAFRISFAQMVGENTTGNLWYAPGVGPIRGEYRKRMDGGCDMVVVWELMVAGSNQSGEQKLQPLLPMMQADTARADEVDEWIKDLKQESPRARLVAVRKLGNSRDPRAVESLIACLKDKHSGGTRPCSSRLGRAWRRAGGGSLDRMLEG